MFTGIVQQLGTVLRAEGRDPMRLELELERPLEGLELGESLAVDGVCLTVTRARGKSVSMDVSHETLARSTLGALRPGARVHLERALRARDLLGGHLVQGHVDGLGAVRAVRAVQGSVRLELGAAPELLRYLVPLGSIAVNGVSLTIVDLGAEAFAVNLVPHTQQLTTLGTLCAGAAVNLEVDVVAKYVERLLEPYRPPTARAAGGLSEELLRKQGYL